MIFLDGEEIIDCKTVSGPSSNRKCIFPFVFNGTIYNKCAHDADDFWCSTKVDSKGCHIGGQGNWGICGPNCFKGIDDQSYKKSVHNLIKKTQEKNKLTIFIHF